MGLGRAMWLFWSWPADTGCTTQQQRPGDQVFLWASRNPDLVTHVCQLSHPGRQPARAMVWLLVPVLSIRLQCPCLFPCLQKMKQLMARERKKTTHQKHPDNRGADTLSQDVVPSSCLDWAGEGPPHPRKNMEGCGGKDVSPNRELTSLRRTVVWSQA